MITFTTTGSFHHTDKFLEEMTKDEVYAAIGEIAQEGTDALAEATPQRTGTSAESWYHVVHHKSDQHGIAWFNFNVDEHGTPIVILIQYGHGTRRGAYVEAYDFINEAIGPIMDRITDEIWTAVTTA